MRRDVEFEAVEEAWREVRVSWLEAEGFTVPMLRKSHPTRWRGVGEIGWVQTILAGEGRGTPRTRSFDFTADA